MVIAQLSFYEELIHLDVPSTFKQFQLSLQSIYGLDLRDIEELSIFFKEGSEKFSISNDEQYKAFLNKLEAHSKVNLNELFTIYLEVNEQSKLYKQQMESNNNHNFILVDSTISKEIDISAEMEREKLLKEIQDKEKLLQEIALREKEEAEAKLLKEQEIKERKQREEEEAARLEREERKRVELEGQQDEIKKLKKSLEETTKKLSEIKKIKVPAIKNLPIPENLKAESKAEDKIKESIEKINKLEKEEEQKQIAEEVLKNQFSEINKELLVCEISKYYNEIFSNNIEKMKEELIQKSVKETLSLFEDKNKQSNNVLPSSNNTIHKGFSCNECNVFPIVGNRYRCTECYDYDMCESCENKLGDKHQHALIKHRQEIKRNNFGQGGCPYRRNRYCSKNDVEDFSPHQFLNKIGNKVKNFFNDCKIKQNDQKQEEKKAEKDVIDISIENTSNKVKDSEKDDIKVEDVKSEKSKVQQVKELFIFGELSEQEVEAALLVHNNDVNQTVEYLATLFWNKKN